MDHTGPSWLAGIETVVGSWLAVGELEGVEQALERMRTRLETAPSTSLARATEAILRGRLLLAQGRPEQAVAAAGHALTESAGRAPWWRAKAIRILDHAGAADGSLIDEATSSEMSLGIR
jgi:ATP/maltotriose-dependent transcriptional regulator MalT